MRVCRCVYNKPRGGGKLVEIPTDNSGIGMLCPGVVDHVNSETRMTSLVTHRSVSRLRIKTLATNTNLNCINI